MNDSNTEVVYSSFHPLASATIHSLNWQHVNPKQHSTILVFDGTHKLIKPQLS